MEEIVLIVVMIGNGSVVNAVDIWFVFVCVVIEFSLAFMLSMSFILLLVTCLGNDAFTHDSIEVRGQGKMVLVGANDGVADDFRMEMDLMLVLWLLTHEVFPL